MLHTYLDLSTEHLTPETMDTLMVGPRYTSWPAMSIGRYAQGMFATVPTIEQNLETLPPDLAVVMGLCQDLGITVVRFDAGGAHCGQLPTYEWK